MHPSWWFFLDRSDPLHGFGSVAAIVLAFLLVFGLLGGWLLAGRMGSARVSVYLTCSSDGVVTIAA